jgi:hypothetical protein
MSTFTLPSGWIPPAKLIDDVRRGLAEMDSALAGMHAIEPLGEDDLDEAWAELTEAYAAQIDRIRHPLEAEDWTTLIAVLIEDRDARAGRHADVGGLKPQDAARG